MNAFQPCHAVFLPAVQLLELFVVAVFLLSIKPVGLFLGNFQHGGGVILLRAYLLYNWWSYLLLLCSHLLYSR